MVSGGAAILAALRAGSPRSGIRPILRPLHEASLNRILPNVVQRALQVLVVANEPVVIVLHPECAGTTEYLVGFSRREGLP